MPEGLAGAYIDIVKACTRNDYGALNCQFYILRPWRPIVELDGTPRRLNIVACDGHCGEPVQASDGDFPGGTAE